jgi:hypothetical protein
MAFLKHITAALVGTRPPRRQVGPVTIAIRAVRQGGEA